jgi:hypothetical protein
MIERDLRPRVCHHVATATALVLLAASCQSNPRGEPPARRAQAQMVAAPPATRLTETVAIDDRLVGEASDAAADPDPIPVLDAGFVPELPVVPPEPDAGEPEDGGGPDAKDNKPVETAAITATLECLNKKQANTKEKLSPADAIDCFDKACTYQLVMSVKSLHEACYTPGGCELPRVLVHCGKPPSATIASFNLCPVKPDHFEVAEQVGTSDAQVPIFGMSMFEFPWHKQQTIGAVLITDKNKTHTCFGGTCHWTSKVPAIANGGIPHLDQPPKLFPTTQTDLENVCKCLADETFTRIKRTPNAGETDVDAANIALVRKMCPLLRDRFKPKPGAK